MNYEKYFKDMFESILDYRKIVLIIFLTQNDRHLLREIGFSAPDINRLNEECKKILPEQNENYLDHIKNDEASIIEKILIM